MCAEAAATSMEKPQLRANYDSDMPINNQQKF
jgi:hypothetical protein